MKKFIKNNIAVIISFFILFIMVNIFCIRYVYNDKIESTQSETARTYCKLVLESDSTNEMCLNIVNSEYAKKDALTVFYSITNEDDYSNIYYLLIPFLIISSSLYTINRRYKHQEIKNYLTREDYNSYMKSIFKDAYKSVIIWPLLTIYGFIISYLISGTFDPSYVLSSGISSFSMEILAHPFVFMISYLLNTIFMSIFYINIAIFLAPENRNYAVSVIESAMVYFGIVLLNTFFVISVLLKNVKFAENYFDFFDMYTYSNRELIPFNIVCFAIMIISYICVKLKYKNKEKIIIKLEKN